MVSYYRIVVAACLCATFLGEVAAADVNSLRRETRFGMVEGYADDASKVWVWMGVPFAKPPVGNLRWRAPQDPEPWEGTRSAKERPSECIQPKYEPPLTILPETTGSEDCLYLNIYRPQTAEENLPVYIWIHGGGNVFGDASGGFVKDLARKANIVLVSIQYRLGVFGYFTHPAFRSEGTAAENSGNFGTLDQIKALSWVRQNIAAFGGNPFNVTIGGYSAGGHNVAQLKISPLARGLFQRAVIQSDPWLAQSMAEIDKTANRTIDNALRTRNDVRDSKDTRRVRTELRDDELVTFLRSVPAAELVTAHFSGRTNPVWSRVIEDGLVIPGNLHRVVESGRYGSVPTIIGGTETEAGFANMCLGPQYEGMADYRELDKVVKGGKTLEEVLPTQKDREYWLKARDYCSLFSQAMNNEHAKRLAVRQDDVYVYCFCWGGKTVCGKTHAFTFGAAHLLDLPFFFGCVDQTDEWVQLSPMFRSFTQANRSGRLALSDAMVSYLAQFLRTGNPNNAVSGLPEWQAWSNHVGGPKTLQLDADLVQHTISMGTQELSVAGVRRALDSEPAELRRHVLALVSVLQPFIPYEPNDFDFAIER